MEKGGRKRAESSLYSELGMRADKMRSKPPPSPLVFLFIYRDISLARSFPFSLAGDTLDWLLAAGRPRGRCTSAPARAYPRPTIRTYTRGGENPFTEITRGSLAPRVYACT